MKTFKNRIISIFMLTLLLGGAALHAGGEGWLTDYEAAVAKAKEGNKIILIDFQGSDWCPPCIQLNKEVLSTDKFKALAEKSLVLLEADFPRKKKLPEAQMDHNNALAKKFGIQYFPTVLLVDADGKVLDKMVGFPKEGLDGFIKFVEAKTTSGG